MYELYNSYKTPRELYQLYNSYMSPGCGTGGGAGGAPCTAERGERPGSIPIAHSVIRRYIRGCSASFWRLSMAEQVQDLPSAEAPSRGGSFLFQPVGARAFGTPAQKAKYLPDLASGKKVAAYALSEAGSGSDALGAKTSARLSEDGKHWIVNGGKMWITNGGFADVYVVFMKMEPGGFTALI